MKLPQSATESEADLAEIEATQNYCWATFALLNWPEINDSQRKRLGDVVIAAKDEMTATLTLDSDHGFSPEQRTALEKIAA